jgi:Xaa-Pro aminopeptidase
MPLRYDKRVLGQTNSLLERGIDFSRLRQDRLNKIQRAMAERDIGVLLLTDIINIRYASGVSVMPLWTAVNLAHYVLVPVEGSPMIFEYGQAQFRAEQYWSQVRPAHYWQARFTEQFAPEQSDVWAAEIKDVLQEWGLAGAKVGIDVLDYHGFSALGRQGLTLSDADEAMEAARAIKTMDEIDLLRQSAAITEAALHDLEQAIHPGVTENELLAIFWHRLLAFGGEWCFTRLLASGYRTNPWFYEAGSKMVRPGDLVAIDTDVMGIEGYVCDISRTFLCGDEATQVQKEAYKVAYDYVQSVIELCRVGMGYRELAEKSPELPADYVAQRYPVILHGIGADDEPPFIPYADQSDYVMPQGEFRENMVVSVECYAGKPGEQDGVKLEDEVWITAEGPIVLSLYPYERKLLRE